MSPRPAGPDATTARSDRREALVAILGGLILAIVVGVQIERARRSLHGDETWVASKLQNTGYVPHALSTPPVFYIPARALVRWAGGSELVLRTPALLFGLACAVTPFALRPWLRDLLTARATLIWSALLLLSSPLVFYATRVKQYTAEAFIAALLVSLGAAVAARPEDRRRLLVFGAVGSVAAASAHAAPFVLLGTGALSLSTFLDARSERQGPRRRGALAFLAWHPLFALVFAVAWLSYLSPGAEVEREFGDLSEYFRRTATRYYFDGSASFLVERTRHWMGHYLNLTRFGLPLVALVVAAWLFDDGGDTRRRSRLALAACCALPILAVLGASAGEAYPYGEVRLMAFCFPGVALLVALGFDHAMSRRPSIALPARAVTILFLVVYSVQGFAFESYNRTYMRSFDQRAIWSALAENVHAGDRIEVGSSAGAALLYHEPELVTQTRRWEERPSRPGPLPVPVWPQAETAVWVVDREEAPLFAESPAEWRMTLELENEGVRVRRFERASENRP